MTKLTIALAILAAAVPVAAQNLSAKSLFYGTDGSVVSVATAPPVAAAPMVAAAPASSAKPRPATTRIAAAKKPVDHIGAGYFIRLKQADGTSRDVLATRSFQSGEQFQLGVKVNKPSYVYIFNEDPDGKVTQLYPRPGQANFIDAMGVVFFPAQGSFQFDNNPGVEQLSVYLAPRPMDDARGQFTASKPDLVSDPTVVPVASAACGPAPAPAAAPDAGRATHVAMADTGALAHKGINFKEQAACAPQPKLASKAIVFTDDPAPAAGGQVASYVMKQQAKPTDGLHLQIKLLHR